MANPPYPTWGVNKEERKLLFSSKGPALQPTAAYFTTEHWAPTPLNLTFAPIHVPFASLYRMLTRLSIFCSAFNRRVAVQPCSSSLAFIPSFAHTQCNHACRHSRVECVEAWEGCKDVPLAAMLPHIGCCCFCPCVAGQHRDVNFIFKWKERQRCVPVHLAVQSR